jgi:AcrR family transcriptional regulator
MSTTGAVKTKVSDKRAAILEATLDLIAERGFHDTPMSMIAKESGVSAGIIYHYFENKEELIFDLYYEIKRDMFKMAMHGFSEQLPYRQRFINLWLNFLHYHLDHPRETAFLEQFENSPYSQQAHEEVFADEINQFMDFVNQGVEAGIFKQLPFQVGVELTFGVAVSLAKQHIDGTIELDEQLIQLTADACWDAVSV